MNLKETKAARTRIFVPQEQWHPLVKDAYTYKFPILNLVTATILASHTELSGEKMLYWYVAVAVIYIMSRMADHVSTDNLADLCKEADGYGFSNLPVEVNPHLSDIPAKQEIYGTEKTTVDMLTMINGIVFPPFGAIHSILSLLASVHNHRIRVELEKKVAPYRRAQAD